MVQTKIIKHIMIKHKNTPKLLKDSSHAVSVISYKKIFLFKGKYSIIIQLENILFFM